MIQMHVSFYYELNCVVYQQYCYYSGDIFSFLAYYMQIFSFAVHNLAYFLS